VSRASCRRRSRCRPEDARTTADTVRNLIHCLKTHLAEIDLNEAAGCVGFTTEGSLEIPH